MEPKRGRTPGERSRGDSDELESLFALLEDVAAKAQAARPRTSEGLSDAQTLALGLFVAAFEVFLGIRALLRERLAEEARMLSRTLLDDTTRLGWLALARDDPDELESRTLRYVFDSLDHERRLMKVALENGYKWAQEELDRVAEELEIVEGEAQKRGLPLKKMPKPVDLFRSMQQEKLYYWHVRASQSIHSSRVGFSARFTPGTDAGAPTRIVLESPIDEVARVGAMAIQTFTLVIIGAVDVLGWDGRDDLVEYRERVVRLSTELFTSIAGEEPAEGGGIDPTPQG